jgi:NADH-quinone oxidoreductase subunit N
MLVLAQQLPTGPIGAGWHDLTVMGPVLVLIAAVLGIIILDVIVRIASRNKTGLGLTASIGIAIGASAAAACWAIAQWLAVDLSGVFAAQQGFVAFGPENPTADTTINPQLSSKYFWSGGALVADHFAIAVMLAVCIVVILVSLLLLTHLKRTGTFRTEVVPLLLISAAGMMLLGLSRDLLITFISIEILSLPLYVLCNLDEKRQTSRESSLKYFLLGAFASGFLIYGIAMVYGVVGHLNYNAIAHHTSLADITPLLAIGLALVGVGLAFKLALAPFHAWAPDVYQGAPTPVTAFMAVGVKLAVFAAAARFILECTANIPPGNWRDSLALFAVLSMIVGNFFALHQMSAKRLLAYSAIAHTGYIALGLCTGDPEASKAILVYLIGYGLASLGAFGLISYLAPANQDDLYLDEMHELSRRAPVTAVALAILMLSMAGFPLTAGFVGKLLVFTDAWKAGLHGLVIFAVLNSVIGVYYYLRFVLAMYMQPKAPGAIEVQIRRMSGAYAIPAIVTVVLTLLIGVMPALLLEWTQYCGVGL